ncbi:DNA-binding response regulator [Ahniella affigens]|uniref:DNA-binding response regulator n=1 Tax=Ahniella affigens TaxID=2021234 RepID=A0A2P1PTJ6_9GAMM|nr:response regulator [Ahniella affigens]AVP98166.1 DNA-binding response regulator [Ahniella affigens]
MSDDTDSRSTDADTAPNVLVVDDEAGIRDLLRQYLVSHGFRVSTVGTAAGARAVLDREPVDLILLDIGLPGEDGLSLTRYLRERWQGAVIIVSGRGDPVERIIGLEVGADDYVAKPFDLRELLARVRSVLRRANRTPATVDVDANSNQRETLNFDGWLLDVHLRQLTAPDGKTVELTTGEFDLLLTLLESPNRVLSREHLMLRLHGREPGPFDRAIDVQISRLRQKIESDPTRPKLIKSVRSVGYVLTASVAKR